VGLSLSWGLTCGGPCGLGLRGVEEGPRPRARPLLSGAGLLPWLENFRCLCAAITAILLPRALIQCGEAPRRYNKPGGSTWTWRSHPRRHHLYGFVSVRIYRRNRTRGHPIDRSRADLSWSRDRTNCGTGLPLHINAGGFAHNYSAAGEHVLVHRERFFLGIEDRGSRVDGAKSPHRKLHLSRIRGIIRIIATRENRIVEMYLFAALVYFLICLGGSMWARSLQRKYAI
jgi:hypothetical protein